jgi:hypothetical protein
MIEIPTTLKKRPVEKLNIFLQADKFEPGEKVYFDDVKLYKL